MNITLNSLFLSFFLSYSDLRLPTHCRCGGLLLHITLNETHIHTRYGSSGRVISLSQKPPSDNTQHSQQTAIHACGGIRTHRSSKRAVADRAATGTGTLNSSLTKRHQRKRPLLGRKRACVFVNLLFTPQRPLLRRYFHSTSQQRYRALETRRSSL
jgi:hypothetical protein